VHHILLWFFLLSVGSHFAEEAATHPPDLLGLLVAQDPVPIAVLIYLLVLLSVDYVDVDGLLMFLLVPIHQIDWFCG
jgi:hypothetical protein